MVLSAFVRPVSALVRVHSFPDFQFRWRAHSIRSQTPLRSRRKSGRTLTAHLLGSVLLKRPRLAVP